jgi:hypothetical protein
MTVKRIFCCLLLMSCGSVSVAQAQNSDRCNVAVLDVTGLSADEIKSAGTNRTKQLGTFDTVIGEGEVTTKVYRLPKTRLFLIANVSYDDETLASTKGADSVSLELTVSTRRTRDLLRSLIFADTEVPLNGFDVGRVSTMVRASGRKQFVIMECRAHQRN